MEKDKAANQNIGADVDPGSHSGPGTWFPRLRATKLLKRKESEMVGIGTHLWTGETH